MVAKGKKYLKASPKIRRILRLVGAKMQLETGGNRIKEGDALELLLEQHRPDLMERAREIQRIREGK